jgi:hypothetical protein
VDGVTGSVDADFCSCIYIHLSLISFQNNTTTWQLLIRRIIPQHEFKFIEMLDLVQGKSNLSLFEIEQHQSCDVSERPRISENLRVFERYDAEVSVYLFTIL